jgi:alkanesulfonate monooxygenase SsuD/methylene tetrahydromethanopterin reductase-like flavin-dependent oxidoreductase (luciferase family)
MADDLEQLVTLERLGFEEAWIGEHFTTSGSSATPTTSPTSSRSSSARSAASAGSS